MRKVVGRFQIWKPENEVPTLTSSFHDVLTLYVFLRALRYALPVRCILTGYHDISEARNVTLFRSHTSQFERWTVNSTSELLLCH
jgi:hypothetical protein